MSSQWKKVAYLAVGGLTEVGFAAGSLLLVVSHQGRGVAGLASGELLARDRQETGAWSGAARRTVPGTGRWTARGTLAARPGRGLPSVTDEPTPQIQQTGPADSDRSVLATDWLCAARRTSRSVERFRLKANVGLRYV